MPQVCLYILRKSIYCSVPCRTLSMLLPPSYFWISTMSAVIPTFLLTLKEHLLQGVLLAMPLQTLEGNHYFGLNIRFDYHLILVISTFIWQHFSVRYEFLTTRVHEFLIPNFNPPGLVLFFVHLLPFVKSDLLPIRSEIKIRNWGFVKPCDEKHNIFGTWFLHLSSIWFLSI